jgi:Asp-tRNA(Asn)/Glu-tRNA(Gln) amidotransferase A subunit family amidase
MHPDLHASLARMQRGQTSASAEIDRAIAQAQSDTCAKVFTATSFEQARSSAIQSAHLPLAGLAVTVKDLFDVQGQVTTAGSTVLAERPPASQDAPSVARLRAAGAALLGRTNMSEFAFSGVGVNPHHGTPANALMTDVPRIPGGSSSGAAISVASGAAFIGLGSDTGGSIRIPAALNGLVGFKNTARLVPTAGTIPLSFTMDTVCALTRSVRDAVLAHEILTARQVRLAPQPISAWRLAVASTVMLDGLDNTVASTFAQTLDVLRKAGAQIDELPLREIGELAGMQTHASLSPVESFAWHEPLLPAHAQAYDPRVLARIMLGSSTNASSYVQLLQARRDWITRMQAALQGYDAVLSPTVPILPPPIADVAPGQERDEAFFKTNALLLRNPSVVNMLDGCAISIPCHTSGEPPVGLMIWQGALHDDAILSMAVVIENLLSRR